MPYKGSRDFYFVEAAKDCQQSYEECVRYIDYLRAMERKYPERRRLDIFINDFDYDCKFAKLRIETMKAAVETLEQPERSTPAERHRARALIALCASWNIAWRAGDATRYSTRDDWSDVAPDQQNGYAYTPPDQDNVTLLPPPPDGIDPYADNQ